jgi:hypothetical protein
MASGDPVPWSLIATRVYTNEIVANSATYGATEVVLYTVTAFLTGGQTYAVEAILKVAIDVASDVSFIRIREDTLTGNQLEGANSQTGSTNGNGFPVVAITEYTPSADGNKVFVITGQRASGTGTAHGVKASPNRKSYIRIYAVID